MTGHSCGLSSIPRRQRVFTEVWCGSLNII